jgi:hypothetical protein
LIWEAPCADWGNIFEISPEEFVLFFNNLAKEIAK